MEAARQEDIRPVLVRQRLTHWAGHGQNIAQRASVGHIYIGTHPHVYYSCTKDTKADGASGLALISQLSFSSHSSLVLSLSLMFLFSAKACWTPRAFSPGLCPFSVVLFSPLSLSFLFSTWSQKEVINILTL